MAKIQIKTSTFVKTEKDVKLVKNMKKSVKIAISHKIKANFLKEIYKNKLMFTKW